MRPVRLWNAPADRNIGAFAAIYRNRGKTNAYIGLRGDALIQIAGLSESPNELEIVYGLCADMEPVFVIYSRRTGAALRVILIANDGRLFGVANAWAFANEKIPVDRLLGELTSSHVADSTARLLAEADDSIHALERDGGYGDIRPVEKFVARGVRGSFLDLYVDEREPISKLNRRTWSDDTVATNDGVLFVNEDKSGNLVATYGTGIWIVDEVPGKGLVRRTQLRSFAPSCRSFFVPDGPRTN